MMGKLRGIPDQLPSSLSALSKPSAPPALVSPITDFEYQAVRVLMSVLLIPAPKTLMST